MSDWTVVLGYEAQRDMWTFGWDRTNEVAGAVFGRFETSGINRRDTGRHLFVRRIIQSDHGGTPDAVSLDYESVYRLQTLPVPSRPGSNGFRSGGRTGADDYGVWVGMIHSHPGIDRQRELSSCDIRTAAANALNGPPSLGLAGRPFLEMLATAGEAWSEGEPIEDWANPVIDYHLVFSDRSIIRPCISVMSEVEWIVEEKQRELLATGGGN